MTKEQCIGLIGGKLRGKAVMMLESGYSPDFVYNFLKRKAVKVLEGVPPLTFKTNGSPLIDYTIYGNTGGVGDRTKNLFDKSSVSRGKYIDANGNEQTSTHENPSGVLNHTDFIKISADESYCISAENASMNTCAFCWYDSNKNLLSRDTFRPTVEADYVQSHTSPSTAEYLIVNFITANMDTVQIEHGSAATDFEPYGCKIPIICGDTTTPIYLSTPLNAGDTLSKSDTGVEIPTVSGNNTLAVGTQVQPAKAQIKYRGG